MNHAGIFQEGFRNGYNAAMLCEYDLEEAKKDLVTGEEVDETDVIIHEAIQAEENARQFTPFEHLAKELNESEDSEDSWDTYEQGVSSGIAAGAKDRLAQ